MFKRLQFAKVRIVTLAEGEIGPLHIGLKGTMNALFLVDLADKTRRGLQGVIEHGRSAGDRCFGYDVVRTGPDGQPTAGLLRISPDEAKIVVRIMREYAAGKSSLKIARAANNDGLAGPRTAGWVQARSTALPSAGPASSTTNSTLVNGFGTAKAISEIQRPMGG